MRISDLSRQSGIPVATIRFYLREKLLPPGTMTARNQAEYDERHLRRIRFVRALTNMAALDLTSVRELVSMVDDHAIPLPEVFRNLNRLLYPHGSPAPRSESIAEAQNEIDGFIHRMDWRNREESAGPEALAQVVATLRSLGCDDDLGFLENFAEAASRLAVAEMELLPASTDDVDRGAMIARAVMFKVAFQVLHRMAHEHHASLRFPEPATPAPPTSPAQTARPPRMR
ncbi:MerR family transcriptional regulator [Actinoplanes italicus]|uniref:Transcriptional regulator n=1 Tax=Actinoplanes italicus TaxID=113567 RepID=A0A2T0K8J3_9ACTN|nr:MerR family transcriptional regulator [Actinoplanes italicus]PRX19377.1 transcriptional regulator [Actinoplanes italicus]